MVSYLYCYSVEVVDWLFLASTILPGLCHAVINQRPTVKQVITGLATEAMNILRVVLIYTHARMLVGVVRIDTAKEAFRVHADHAGNVFR